jgi:hypothetical protein
MPRGERGSGAVVCVVTNVPILRAIGGGTGALTASPDASSRGAVHPAGEAARARGEAQRTGAAPVCLGDRVRMAEARIMDAPTGIPARPTPEAGSLLAEVTSRPRPGVAPGERVRTAMGGPWSSDQ